MLRGLRFVVVIPVLGHQLGIDARVVIRYFGCLSPSDSAITASPASFQASVRSGAALQRTSYTSVVRKNVPCLIETELDKRGWLCNTLVVGAIHLRVFPTTAG